MNNRKDVPAVMKKPKLKKGEKVAYRNNENILLLAWCDKRLVTLGVHPNQSLSGEK
jgi:hypothetical protein